MSDIDQKVLRRRRGQGLDIAIIVGDPQVAAELSQVQQGGEAEGELSSEDMLEASAGDGQEEEVVPTRNEFEGDEDRVAEERGLAPGGEEMTTLEDSLEKGLGGGEGGLRGAAKAFWKKKSPPMK